MRAGGERDRRADLGDGDRAQFLDLRIQRITKLAQAMHPQRDVTRPVAVVERRTGRGDGTVHVGGVGVGRGPDRLLGRRVDRGEGPRAAGYQRPGDEQIGHSGSRATGHDMHRGPPRPVPSSDAAIGNTSMPESCSRALVSALRS